MNAIFFFKEGLEETMIKEKLKETLLVVETSQNPDYVFTFGGDGTFLDAVKKYGHNPIYVPINMGTLGFYTSWTIDELLKLKQDIKNDNLVLASTIDITVLEKNKQKTFNCLNEATVLNPIMTQILEVYIDKVLLENFRGTGICVSTPTGSTAYNKSLGGAIFSSTTELFQLTHIAPINNVHYRNIGNPLVFSKGEILKFKASKQEFEHAILTVDREVYKLDKALEVLFKMSEKKVKILVPNDNNFYERVKKAFIK
jgi:NAD+ kinase